jgi:hypothetical protein
VIAAIDYAALAALFMLREIAHVNVLPRTRTEFATLLSSTYGREFEPDATDKIVRRLEAWGFLSVFFDKYAGEQLSLLQPTSDELIKKLADGELQPLILNANSGGTNWFATVFANNQFWVDLRQGAGTKSPLDFEPGNTQIPASDRIVTLGHNQITSLVKSTNEVINAVENSTNSIDGDVGLRARLIGQLKAARELILSGIFRVEALKLTLIEALHVLIARYEKELVGALAATLLAELAKVMVS